MSATAIEWADLVWNPIVGCSIASRGCANCYAMSMAARIERMDAALGGRLPHYHGLTRKVNGKPVWTGIVRPAPKRVLVAPLSWRKPARVFVNSMSDLFHDDVPDQVIDQVFAVMALCPHLTFIVVTKRSARMLEYVSTAAERIADVRHHVLDELNGRYIDSDLIWPLPNVWLLVSAEDQPRANERIPHLLATPAAKRGVSLEPMLGAIDIDSIERAPSDHDLQMPGRANVARHVVSALTGQHGIEMKDGPRYWSEPRSARLDWVITGFENGDRPGHPDWVRDVRDQCAATNTAYFHKQNGTWRVVADLDRDDPGGGRAAEFARTTPKGRWLNIDAGHGFHGKRVLRVVPTTKAAAGAELDGKLHREFPR